MGCWGTTPPIHPPIDAHTCPWIWTERSREVNSPWPLIGPPKAGLWGRGIHHPAGRTLDIQQKTGDLYHQVYALRRLPRPPLCGPERAQEITKEIVSSLKDHLRWRKGEQPGRGGEAEGTKSQHSQLVARVSGDPRGKWLLAAHPDDKGLLQAPPIDEWNPRCWILLFGTSSPQVHLPEWIPTASKPNVLLPGYQGGTVSEDFGICTSFTVLGGEVQPANTRPATSFGKVCDWI